MSIPWSPAKFIWRPSRALIAAGFLVVVGLDHAAAQQPFKTPQAAVDALIAAAKAKGVDRIIAVLGGGGRDIASSGDKVADKVARDNFLKNYETKHSILLDGDKKAILVVGEGDWPFPIPIVQKDRAWQFDTLAGRREILYRRIGRNELQTIQVCLAYVDAQNDYAAVDPEKTGLRVYAQRIISHSGKKNGLFWPTTANEPPSPLGDLMARASAAGYRPGKSPIPFHGYYYRILSRQGPAAPGGAYDYVVRGKMIGGFALIAYPAQYGNSGVMTFVVNHDGIVYQKDLGKHTRGLVSKITAFDPDQTWKRVTQAPAKQ